MNNSTKLMCLVLLVFLLSSVSRVFGIGEVVDRDRFKFGCVSIAYDSGNDAYYVQNEDENIIYMLNATDFTILGQFDLPFTSFRYPIGMTYDGTNLWFASPWSPNGEGRLYAYNPATMDSVTAFDTGLGGDLRGVAWDGNNLWVGATNYGWAWKFSPTGVKFDSIPTPEVVWYNDLTVVQNALWVNDDRFNFRNYDLSTGALIQTVPSQVPTPWGQMSIGLTTNGTELITVPYGRPYIYKIYIGLGPGEYLYAPGGVTAFSDQSMPTSIRLNWNNPTHFVNGNPGMVASLNIYDYDTDALIANVTGEEYVVTGLTNGEAYNFYIRAVNNAGGEGMLSEKFGTRAGGLLAGDLISKLPLYQDGWTSIAFDGTYAWVFNENGGFWAKIDLTTGDTLKTVPFGQWSNGAFWDESDSTIWLNSPGTGVGEVWQIDTLGNLMSWFPTDLNPANSCRGIAFDGTNIWIGQTDQSTFYLFDKFGQDVATVYADSAIGWQRGMEWVGDKLWILDGGAQKLRIFTYNGSDSIHQVAQVDYWWEGWPLDLVFTGTEVVVANWQSANLYFLYPGPAVGIENPEDQVPFIYNLAQNYPNPFNPETRIEYSIAKNGPVQLYVYNMLGQRIATLVDQKQSAGRHTVLWNGRNDQGIPVSSGIYFYQIKAGDFSKVKKMVLVH
ncbi:MAG: hypothetical protein Kow0042_19190 [Calditrichia bacterium]